MKEERTVKQKSVATIIIDSFDGRVLVAASKTRTRLNREIDATSAHVYRRSAYRIESKRYLSPVQPPPPPPPLPPSSLATFHRLARLNGGSFGSEPG